MTSLDKRIGIGWCVVTDKYCGFSQGHGADGNVKCTCKTACVHGESK